MRKFMRTIEFELASLQYFENGCVQKRQKFIRAEFENKDIFENTSI